MNAPQFTIYIIDIFSPLLTCPPTPNTQHLTPNTYHPTPTTHLRPASDSIPRYFPIHYK